MQYTKQGVEWNVSTKKMIQGIFINLKESTSRRKILEDHLQEVSLKNIIEGLTQLEEEEHGRIDGPQGWRTRAMGVLVKNT